MHDATNHHASPGKPQLIRGVLHVAFYWLYTTLGWLSANPVADSVAGAKQFDHERYRATRLSTKRLNERMAVDWLDRTQPGRNDRARIGLGWWSIPANGFVPLGPGAWRVSRVDRGEALGWSLFRGRAFQSLFLRRPFTSFITKPHILAFASLTSSTFTFVQYYSRSRPASVSNSSTRRSTTPTTP